MWINLLFFKLFLVIQANFLNLSPSFQEYWDKGNPGEPLYLTPLIKAGLIEDARLAARVTDQSLGWLSSYSGYLTVNEQYNSNMFFWLFLSANDPQNDPIVLWLQGGPGATSLFGLLGENGPLFLNEDGKVQRRDYSWHRNCTLIYIDNPVGTGYSFTDRDEGYARNEEDVGRDLYEAIKQLFKLFPTFQQLPFFITGESYAGKYVPALAYHIHRDKQHQQQTEPDIRLTGMAIGNGFSDPKNQLNYGDYLYQHGLVDKDTLNILTALESLTKAYIAKKDMENAFRTMNVHRATILEYTGFSNPYNYLKSGVDSTFEKVGKYLQKSETRSIIHVGNNTFNDKWRVFENLVGDIMDTVAPWIAELLNYYPIFFYNGQLDIIVAYPLTVNFLEQLNFTGADLYRTAKRKIWKVDGDIAGYVKNGGYLTEIMVRNAGHMVPTDQPKWAFDMINRLTSGKEFD